MGAFRITLPVMLIEEVDGRVQQWRSRCCEPGWMVAMPTAPFSIVGFIDFLFGMT